jgi:hypothetical protein
MKPQLLSPERKRRLYAVLVDHPTLWLILGIPFFICWAGVIPMIGWNAIEMMIGHNLLIGRGYIVAPLDPPALWRPMLGSFVCAAVELITRDPLLVFEIVYTASLAIFTASIFYTAHRIWGRIAAHAACFFVFTSPGLTSLLTLHVHGLSHIVFLAAVGPAILCTVAALSRPTPALLAVTGFAWGLTYLARPETIVFAAASFLLLGNAARQSRHLKLCVWMLMAFSTVWVPVKLYELRVKSQYHLWGATLLLTFYNSEAWANGVNDEAAGFDAAGKMYGPVESHDFSFAKMISRHPEALRVRFRTNFPQVISLFRRNRLCNLAWLAFIPFLAIHMLSFRPEKLALSVYFLSMVLFPILLVLVMHVDPRYLVIGVPGLLFLSVGGVTSCWHMIVRSRRRWLYVLGSLCLIAGTVRIGRATYNELAPLLRSGAFGRARLQIRQAQALAQGFLRYSGATSPKVLLVPDLLPPDIGMFQFLVSYYADTAIPWPRSPVYPIEKIFSMVHKVPDYEFVPQHYLYTTHILANRKPLGRVSAPEQEPYYLFRYDKNAPAMNLSSDRPAITDK